MNDLCHACNGTGKDQLQVAAAAYNDRCVNCRGTGIEPEWDRDEEEDDLDA